MVFLILKSPWTKFVLCLATGRLCSYWAAHQFSILVIERRWCSVINGIDLKCLEAPISGVQGTLRLATCEKTVVVYWCEDSSGVCGFVGIGLWLYQCWWSCRKITFPMGSYGSPTLKYTTILRSIWGVSNWYVYVPFWDMLNIYIWNNWSIPNNSGKWFCNIILGWYMLVSFPSGWDAQDLVHFTWDFEPSSPSGCETVASEPSEDSGGHTWLAKKGKGWKWLRLMRKHTQV